MLSKRDFGRQRGGSKSPEKMNKPKKGNATRETSTTNPQPVKPKTTNPKKSKLSRQFHRLKKVQDFLSVDTKEEREEEKARKVRNNNISIEAINATVSQDGQKIKAEISSTRRSQRKRQPPNVCDQPVMIC